jgi:hypothetical protein
MWLNATPLSIRERGTAWELGNTRVQFMCVFRDLQTSPALVAQSRAWVHGQATIGVLRRTLRQEEEELYPEKSSHKARNI